jgi:hypothetical protein
MSVWVLVFLVAAVKIPIAALMLWLPFRSDRALPDDDVDSSSENGGDGGIKTPPSKPRKPHPRSPLGHTRQRGHHGSPASPARVRLRSIQRQRVTR